ncbi:hypothetical protein BBJ29_005946 [Phytophthora kernoviae]|uniref:RING-type domain-containing protein n=1 Tax=Phytophthora kernoviae TaxID=325452 RepID=A0A3F2RPR0_9STRA|nr:hypothetical protein BBJ29_005946 [Phytophthora kernoviae]RLN61475.1 hypothetical protein BBP00_00005378 [Phytophthora kernoviae]
MKFGKRVRSLASPKWADDYVDYKTLKKQIKQVFAEDADCNDDNIGKHVAWFQSLLETEMQKLNDAHSRILDELVNGELKPLQQALGTRWVLPHATARTLLMDVLQLSHQVDAFRRFVVLNSLALVKIAKKFDKAANADVVTDHDDDETTSSRLKVQVLEDLKSQLFYDAGALDGLCDETAALTDRVMLCVLPDGNFQLGPRSLTCPICLCSNVQAPITLSCAHTFCWSCLSRAAQHRFRSCPLCRRAQSVDPRDYEIDGLVKRFKRAYEFVEQGLDMAPLVASPMCQILAEAFEVGNAYLREVEDQYAALAPLPSATLKESELEPSQGEHTKLPELKLETSAVVSTVEKEKIEVLLVEEPPASFEKGDIVEILHDEQWYAGVVLQHNEGHGGDDTYSVLWTGTITSTSVTDSSGSEGQDQSVGSGSTGSSVGDGEVGVKHILHFSDAHLNVSESSAEIPIQYGYDAPIRLLTSALEYAQQVLPNPDFFLYTGDYVVHNDPSEEYAAEAVKVGVEKMAQYFPGVANGTLAATAILGNTDTSPDYVMNVTDPDTEENPSIQAVSGAWNDSLTASNLKDFNARGYLSYELDEKLVVLTLNTVPYSPKHTPNATTDDADPFSQFQWLNATLEDLRNSSKFAYITGHIPPIIDAQDGSPMWEASYIDSYKKIVTKYADVVKAQIFGHTHSIEFRLPLTSDMESQDPEDVITADDNNSSGSSHIVPLFMAAAISPIFYSNPAFMVWDYHATTYELLDFTVYGTNISSDNEADFDWHQIFKASTAYNVSSLSWSEMNNFIMAAAVDSEIVEQYYYNSQAQSYQQNSCEDSVCLTWYLCSMMWWSTPEDYTACLASGSRLESSAASPTLFSLTGLLMYALTATLALWV